MVYKKLKYKLVQTEHLVCTKKKVQTAHGASKKISLAGLGLASLVFVVKIKAALFCNCMSSNIYYVLYVKRNIMFLVCCCEIYSFTVINTNIPIDDDTDIHDVRLIVTTYVWYLVYVNGVR